MQEFKKHRQKTHYLLRFFGMLGAVALLFAVAGVAATSAWGMYGTFNIAAAARADAEKSLRSAKEDEARITAAVAGLDSKEGLEKEVRERFGVAKPGEGEIRIVRDTPQDTGEPAEEQNIFIRTLRSLFVW